MNFSSIIILRHFLNVNQILPEMPEKNRLDGCTHMNGKHPRKPGSLQKGPPDLRVIL